MGQNRNDDEDMPHRVAPSTNIVDPAPLGLRVSSMVDNCVVRVIKFYF